MCIFCTALPAAAVLGAAAKAKQRRQQAQQPPAADPLDLPVTPLFTRLPVGTLTGVVLAGLVTAAVLTHKAGLG